MEDPIADQQVCGHEGNGAEEPSAHALWRGQTIAAVKTERPENRSQDKQGHSSRFGPGQTEHEIGQGKRHESGDDIPS